MFGTLLPDADWDDEDTAMVEVIGGYWTRFAASGDPNGEGAVQWPVYDEASDTHLRLGDPIETDDARRSSGPSGQRSAGKSMGTSSTGPGPVASVVGIFSGARMGRPMSTLTSPAPAQRGRTIPPSVSTPISSADV